MYVNILFPINAEAFTYSVPKDIEPAMNIGCRVHVPFKRSEKVGIVVGINREEEGKLNLKGRGISHLHRNKTIILKAVTHVLDDYPFIPENLVNLLMWVGQYYMSSSGLALKMRYRPPFSVEAGQGKQGLSMMLLFKKKMCPDLLGNSTLR